MAKTPKRKPGRPKLGHVEVTTRTPQSYLTRIKALRPKWKLADAFREGLRLFLEMYEKPKKPKD